MVGAANELREIAPHQNGCRTVLVKSYIRSLKTAIGEQLLTPFELYTCLLEIANLLNQRPIGRITYESHVSESDAPWKSNYVRRYHKVP